MFFNYFKLAIRLLTRNPFFTFINVLGLSIGFAAFIVLWPYAQSEFNADQFHKDANRIGRLSRIIEEKRNAKNVSITLPNQNCGLAYQIANEFSEISDMTRIIPQPLFQQDQTGSDRDLF